MFSGIVKKTGIIKKIFKSRNGISFGIKTKLEFSKKDIGTSINCSGVCLTIEKISKELIFFFLSKETIKRKLLSSDI